MSSGEEKSTSKTGYYKLMLYAAIFGAVASLVTTGYITLYNQGNKFFGQHSVNMYNINFCPLILLGGAGVFIGFAIKFFGQHGGPGVAQTQYAQTGGLNYRKLPSILLQGFIALWSGAAVGPEGTLQLAVNNNKSLSKEINNKKSNNPGFGKVGSYFDRAKSR